MCDNAASCSKLKAQGFGRAAAWPHPISHPPLHYHYRQSVAASRRRIGVLSRPNPFCRVPAWAFGATCRLLGLRSLFVSFFPALSSSSSSLSLSVSCSFASSLRSWHVLFPYDLLCWRCIAFAVQGLVNVVDTMEQMMLVMKNRSIRYDLVLLRYDLLCSSFCL